MHKTKQPEGMIPAIGERKQERVGCRGGLIRNRQDRKGKSGGAFGMNARAWRAGNGELISWKKTRDIG